MELLFETIKQDWLVLLPILICSIFTVMVAIDRFTYYNANKRNVISFIPRLQKELISNNLMGAQNLAIQCGGIIGEVTEEAVRILSEQKKGFSRSFDIAAALATRKLEHRLTILGTIGGVAPFLGLFGTVVRILFTFQDLAAQGNQSAAVAFGIGSALIATAFEIAIALRFFAPLNINSTPLNVLFVGVTIFFNISFFFLSIDSSDTIYIGTFF